MKEVVKAIPRNSDYKLYLAEIIYVYKSDKVDESIKLIKDVISKDPQNYNGWEYLSNLYINENLLEESYQSRKEANKHFADDPRQLYAFAKIAYRLNYKDEAIKALNHLLKMDSSYTLSGANLLSEITDKDVDEILGDKIHKKFYEVEFNNDSGIMYVIGNFEGHPIRFLIDTGATHSVINKNFIEKTGLSIDPYAPLVQYETANGIIQAPVVYGNYGLGDLVITNIRTAIMDTTMTNHDGIIGQNVLSKFLVSIDNESKTMKFTVPST